MGKARSHRGRKAFGGVVMGSAKVGEQPKLAELLTAERPQAD